MADRIGFPAIPVPRDGNPQQLAVAIGNIEQRFRALESAFASQQALSNGQAQQISDGANASYSNLQQQINQLTTTVNNLAASINDSDVTTYTAGEDLGIYQAVVVGQAGVVYGADPLTPERAFGVIGVTLGAVAAGTPVQVRRRGDLLTLGMSSWIAGMPVYVDGTTLTHTPGTGGYVLLVGVAVDTDRLEILPGPSALQHSTPYLGTPYEDGVFVTRRYLKHFKSATGTPSGGGGNVVTFSLGNAVDSDFVLTHGFGNRSVIVEVYRNTTPYDKWGANVYLMDANHCRVGFDFVPDLDEFLAVVSG